MKNVQPNNSKRSALNLLLPGKALIAALLLLILLPIQACETYTQESYTELVVVETYLVAGRTLPLVQVSRTLPVSERYSFEDAALSGANVRLILLNDSGNPEEVFLYSATSRTGIYAAPEEDHTILPRRTYRIEIDFNNRDETLTAVTTVPDQVQVINDVRESVVYQSDEQLEIVLAPTVQTQKQNVFVFDSIAENPTQENLTPFYRAAVVDGDASIEDFRNNSSGLINEGNFVLLPDGSISLFFPWIGAAFYGETLVVTNSVDQNLSDLIRSQEVQLGGSTLSPGEIPNVVYNIEGGIGIFGSLSSDTVRTAFLRP
jgi:hypothetical protein